MAATTKDSVLKIAPELSTVDNDLWNMILTDVDKDVGSEFGEFREVAARYLVAHRLTILTNNTIGESSGPIVKRKVGDVFREYAKPISIEGSDADYTKTKYGTIYLTYRRKIIMGFNTYIPSI
jgi:hypothetical protein